MLATLVHLPTNQSSIEYFPESGKEAGPEVAKALPNAFVNNLGQPTTAPAFAPWKLTTEDKDLASAVSDELKRIGVRPLELCIITLSKPQTKKPSRASLPTSKRLLGIQALRPRVSRYYSRSCSGILSLTPQRCRPGVGQSRATIQMS